MGSGIRVYTGFARRHTSNKATDNNNKQPQLQQHNNYMQLHTCERSETDRKKTGPFGDDLIFGRIRVIRRVRFKGEQQVRVIRSPALFHLSVHWPIFINGDPWGISEK